MIYAAPEQGGSGGAGALLLMVALLALMYFMVIRPQSKRRKEMQRLQDSIAVGTEVLTVGGLYGTVTSIDDDAVTLEVAPGITNRYARAAIGRVVPAEEPAGGSDGDLTAEAAVADEADVAPSEKPGGSDPSLKKL